MTQLSDEVLKNLKKAIELQDLVIGRITELKAELKLSQVLNRRIEAENERLKEENIMLLNQIKNQNLK